MHPWGDEYASAGVGLGRLDHQPVAPHPHGRVAELDRAGVEVDGIQGQPAGLADAQPDGHQERDQVGHVPRDGPVRRS